MTRWANHDKTNQQTEIAASRSIYLPFDLRISSSQFGYIRWVLFLQHSLLIAPWSLQYVCLVLKIYWTSHAEAEINSCWFQELDSGWWVKSKTHLKSPEKAHFLFPQDIQWWDGTLARLMGLAALLLRRPLFCRLQAHLSLMASINLAVVPPLDGAPGFPRGWLPEAIRSMFWPWHIWPFFWLKYSSHSYGTTWRYKPWIGECIADAAHPKWWIWGKASIFFALDLLEIEEIHCTWGSVLPSGPSDHEADGVLEGGKRHQAGSIITTSLSSRSLESWWMYGKSPPNGLNSDEWNIMIYPGIK